MNDKKLLELQIKMIELLIEKDESEYACFVRTFEKETGAEKKDIKTILSKLKQANMVMVDYCVDEDGMISGRGYFLTDRAKQWSIREWLQELKNML